jgi:hypothetical protein
VRRMKPSERPPLPDSKGMVYGISIPSDGQPTRWLCDSEGRVLLWATREGALEGNDMHGWVGDVRQYPSGEK